MTTVTRLRSAANRAYGRWAPNALRRRRGHLAAEPIDLSLAEAVRTAGPDELRDAHWLEHELIPALGLNDDMPHLFPPALQPALGHGLRAWQWPNQLAPYLATVGRYPVTSYIEIGVQHGGTFVATVEYLSRLNRLEEAVALDVMNVPSLRAYARSRRDVRFMQASSRGKRFERLVHSRRWGLVLIDGDHSEEAVRADFHTVRDNADLIAFHDIVDSYSPGVAAVWDEVKREHGADFHAHEFTAQYPEVLESKGATSLGIGLLVRSGLEERR